MDAPIRGDKIQFLDLESRTLHLGHPLDNLTSAPCLRERSYSVKDFPPDKYGSSEKAKERIRLDNCARHRFDLRGNNPVLDYVLTQSDQFPYGEERRLFYVAITRAKIITIVLYDKKYPSVFVDEFLHPETINEKSYERHPNAMKKWTPSADKFLITLYNEGKSIREISEKMGRSQTAIVMRLGKLGIT